MENAAPGISSQMNHTYPLQKKLIIYFIGFTAALAGLLFGLDIGVISGALPFVKNAFKLSVESEGTVVSALLWGAVIGTLISGILSSKLGRRKTILVSALIFVIGSILCAISPSEHLLIGARLFLGVAVGVASFTAPLYLSEISPQKVRGSHRAQISEDLCVMQARSLHLAGRTRGLAINLNCR